MPRGYRLMTAVVGAMLGMSAAATAHGSDDFPRGTFHDFWAGEVRALHVWVSPEPSLDEATATAALAALAARRAHPAPLAVRIHVLDGETGADGRLPAIHGLPSSARAVVLRREAAGIRLHHGRDAALDAAARVLEFPTSREARDLLCEAQRVPAGDARGECELPCCGADRPPRVWRLADFASPREEGGRAGGSLPSFAFSQADLGGPLSRITLEVAGTHDPIPRRTAADLEVLFNGGLVHTTPLGRAERFAFTTAVPRALVRRDNTVSLRIVPGASTPTTVRLEPSARIHVEHGQRLAAGFVRFPQALLPRFQVSIDPLTPAALESAAQLVAAMQRASGAPLVPEVVPWRVGVASRGAWMAIALDPQAGAALGPPLAPAPFRVLGTGRRELVRVDHGVPFASLQAFAANGRDVLLLSHSGWPAGMSMLAGELAVTGLSRLSGDVWVTSTGRLPFSFHARGSALAVETLAASHPLWSGRLRDTAFFFAAAVIVLGLVWSYPRVVRPRPRR